MVSLPLSLFQLLLDSIDVAFTPQSNCDSAHLLQRGNSDLAGSDVPLEGNPADANHQGCFLCGVSLHADIDLYQMPNSIAREFVSYVWAPSCHTHRYWHQYLKE